MDTKIDKNTTQYNYMSKYVEMLGFPFIIGIVLLVFTYFNHDYKSYFLFIFILNLLMISLFFTDGSINEFIHTSSRLKKPYKLKRFKYGKIFFYTFIFNSLFTIVVIPILVGLVMNQLSLRNELIGFIFLAISYFLFFPITGAFIVNTIFSILKKIELSKFQKQRIERNQILKEQRIERKNEKELKKQEEEKHFKKTRIRLSKRYVKNVNCLKQSIIIFDSNIYMTSTPKCNQIFNFIIKNKINTLQLTSEQLDEIQNNRKNFNRETQKSARFAYRLIEKLDEKNLLHMTSVRKKAKKGAYADPEIMQYIQKTTQEKQTIIFVTEDRDLKIRTNQLVKKNGQGAYLEVYNIDTFFNKYISFFDKSFHLEYAKSTQVESDRIAVEFKKEFLLEELKV